MKNIESYFTELTSHLEKNSKNLAEINNTMLRKVTHCALKEVLFGVLGMSYNWQIILGIRDNWLKKNTWTRDKMR